MANKYGEAALLAAGHEFVASADPESRWRSAMDRVYPTSATSRKKDSPRGAFLGLCEEGLVRNIPAGRYTASKDNKVYAVKAAELLKQGMQKPNVTDLWRAVASPEKAHNSQMDVVLALW
ncbi:MAG: DUF6979 family protein, partial [Janthinobacterium lividum]